MSPKVFSIKAWRGENVLSAPVTMTQETDDPQPIVENLWRDGFSGEIIANATGARITFHELSLMSGFFLRGEETEWFV